MYIPSPPSKSSVLERGGCYSGCDLRPAVVGLCALTQCWRSHLAWGPWTPEAPRGERHFRNTTKMLFAFFSVEVCTDVGAASGALTQQRLWHQTMLVALVVLTSVVLS